MILLFVYKILLEIICSTDLLTLKIDNPSVISVKKLCKYGRVEHVRCLRTVKYSLESGMHARSS